MDALEMVRCSLCGCPVPEHQRWAETADPLSPGDLPEPELLVLDEPTSFLDIRHKLELLDILKKLVHERNVAVLMSLHELDLAERISDYVLCAENGTIGRTGTPREVFGETISQALRNRTRELSASLGFPNFPRTDGAPRVFVIGGMGSGIPVYHALNRAGIPFAAA